MKIGRYQDDSAAPEGPVVGRVLKGVRHYAAGEHVRGSNLIPQNRLYLRALIE